ncbi:unnamed protein product [Brachionus calyciflorus]|uniref:tRNA pseudouridine(55) synthase n=1 Tax=Brachionus calyciflorus TaxID=104777 RepID=A0A813ZR26_9BILA|nr:unnamed protein product [Brachionus calyciflorus]
MTELLLKNIIDSLCWTCTKRIFHFQLFTVTASCENKSYFWIQKYLEEKKLKEHNSKDFQGCGICFGLLEKYSDESFLKELADRVNNCGIQFRDFRISLTASNVSTLREKFIELLLESIPISEISLRLYNPKCLSVKELWKILTFHPLEVIMGKLYNHTSLFDVKTKFTIEDSALEADTRLLDTRSISIPEKKLSKKARLQKEIQEVGFTKPNVDLVIKESNLEKFKKYYTLPFTRTMSNFDLECTHDPIFLAGRYLKFSRILSQTKWIIEGARKFSSSIEEIMGEVLSRELGATGFVFTSSGREDIDVKCLGKGRPFTLEFMEPKRTEFTREELKKYQQLINESTTEMAVKDLQYITREQTKLMRESQENKTKSYSALCYCYSKLDEKDIEKLNSLTRVDLLQQTPIRVLHRRTVMTRSRWISDIQASLIDEHHFKIKMLTQGGTYVKEFVHGDLGRTEPSLCTILNKECDILELDVESVNCDFPPEINYDD